ncbi:MAG: hypothetical protein PHO32_00235 [Candidatus Cloacimonetes bacterium]|nr:hypothetical protein [Candidatus Cloacimonadota bacterium]
MKRILILVALLAIMGLWVNLSAEISRGLGLHFGTVSANGFSYRQINGNNGIQATVGAITLGDNQTDLYYYYYGNHGGAQNITVTDDGRRMNLNLGINYIRSLANKPAGRFYIFGGASLLYSRVKQFKQDYTLVSTDYDDHYQAVAGSTIRHSWENRANYYVGTGLGFELNLGKSFKWAIELPITLNEDGDIMMYIPQSGLYFVFD